jgi:plasmid stabilization system protein ParE
MTSKRLSLHPEAIEEPESAARWYRERSPLAAARFVDEINQAILRILEAPQRWPLGLRGTRKVKLPCFPFLLIYYESHDAIQILAVAHCRRRPGYWRTRT